VEPRSGGEAMNLTVQNRSTNVDNPSQVIDENPITVPWYSLGGGCQFPPKGGRLAGR